MIRRLTWRVLGAWYGFLRWVTMLEVDPNEDFECCYCGKPVFRRYLFCSNRCTQAFDRSLQDG